MDGNHGDMLGFDLVLFIHSKTQICFPPDFNQKKTYDIKKTLFAQ